MKESQLMVKEWRVVAGPPGLVVGSIYYNESLGVEGTQNDFRISIERKIKEVKPSKRYAELEKHPDYEMYYLIYPDGRKSSDFFNKDRAMYYATLRSL